MLNSMELRKEFDETKEKVSNLLLYTDTVEFRRSTPKERQLIMIRLNTLKTYAEALAMSLGECWWNDPASL